MWDLPSSSPTSPRCVFLCQYRWNLILNGRVAQAISGPYSEWAEGNIQKIKNILDGARAEHTAAVQSRIDSVGQMKDVVSLTQGLFALSKVSHISQHLSGTLGDLY